ncbi:MAG: TetR/AcrR family transcriptional regulator [Treponema sp.]|nr:TetR/AcrR family transcriptional regulator [Treponema sp.]
MTNDDVISAAFRVWGQELYKTTSLSKLAGSLGVSKPALYRHFPDKQALLGAMEDRFYDDYTDAIKPVLEEAQKTSSGQEKLLTIVQFITGYFARHFDYFIYSLIRLHGSGKDHHFFKMEPMNKRGVSFDKLGLRLSPDHPSMLFLAGVTGLFATGMFHKRRHGVKDGIKPKGLEASSFEQPSEEEIDSFCSIIVKRVRLGLQLDKTLVDTLPYEELECWVLSEGERQETAAFSPPDPILKAVAEVVAEEGPWNASMQTVAKRSGLSKSGLYAHFKSKEDMLSRLFMTEFDRIARYAAVRTETSAIREERLYLAILSIADCLRARPEILVILDWVRIQRLELDLSMPTALYDFFTTLNLDVLAEGVWENTSKWILFLLVSILMHAYAVSGGELQPASLRRMFRFISLGVEGLE